MKKLFSLTLALVMIFCLAPSVFAYGPQNKDFKVRVNGYIVEFPDAQPYVDENSRTLVPVRFVAEQLGAQVSWNQETTTATIEKDGITVDVTINSPYLKVTEDGKTTTTKMDTAAVIKDSRTFVPIRFVAEALGAYVDYSNYWRTVGIYQDILNRDHIAHLRAYDRQNSSGYEESTYAYNKKNETKEYWDIWGKFWGDDREEFGSYETAHEHLYQMFHAADPTFYFPKTNITLTNPSADKFFDQLVQEACKTFEVENERLSMCLIADTSCLYQPDEMSNYPAVRGTVAIIFHVPISELSPDEADLIGYQLRLAEILKDTGGVYHYTWSDDDFPTEQVILVDADIFMSAYSKTIGSVHAAKIRPLCDWYTVSEE